MKIKKKTFCLSDSDYVPLATCVLIFTRMYFNKIRYVLNSDCDSDQVAS